MLVSIGIFFICRQNNNDEVESTCWGHGISMHDIRTEIHLKSQTENGNNRIFMVFPSVRLLGHFGFIFIDMFKLFELNSTFAARFFPLIVIFLLYCVQVQCEESNRQWMRAKPTNDDSNARRKLFNENVNKSVAQNRKKKILLSSLPPPRLPHIINQLQSSINVRGESNNKTNNRQGLSSYDVTNSLAGNYIKT